MTNNKRRKRAAVLLCLTFLAAFSGCGSGASLSGGRDATDGTARRESTAAGTSAAEGESTCESCYYREHFEDRERAVYDAFLKASSNPFSDEIVGFQSAGGSGFVVSIEEADEAYQGFLYDHPEVFWLGSSFQYRRQLNEGGEYDDSMIDGIMTVPVPGSEAELEEKREEFEKTADRLLKTVPAGSSERETARFLHDFLAKSVAYREEAVYNASMKEEHTAYGALVNRQAVCDGYALAYKYLLERCGIDSVAVPGKADGIAHVWNLVYWDGKWHEVDVTWDALSESGDVSRYFDLTTDQMNEDHRREESGVAALAPVAE